MKNQFLLRLTKLILPVIIISALFLFLSAIDSLHQGNLAEEKQQLEEALLQAAVSCYALEGSYPPSLDYLTEHYGIQINEKRFVVKYERYASNLLPDITVLTI